MDPRYEDLETLTPPPRGTNPVWKRRTFLSRVITSLHVLIAGTLGTFMSGAIASPIFGRRKEESWVAAGQLGALIQDVPVPVSISVSRDDGYRQIADRMVVFLVRTANDEVMALDPTCTHLGCRVSWNPDERELKCPCHGGTYTSTGDVKSGPPPAPLQRLDTRLDGDVIHVRV